MTNRPKKVTFSLLSYGRAFMTKPEPETIEDIRINFMGIWSKMKRYSPDDRALVLWALNSDWCMGCGLPDGECDDRENGCCCGVKKVEVTTTQCPKCDFMEYKSLRDREND